ncbi:hypothetical protein BMG523Draft_04594 [Frankia sp. BMG5.23]|nr:hypothetical protein [Frankia sp. B2]KDA40592.1 hypothetical protein BMG523Draft_04594 [Frankia sp. BMG5.23]
MLEVNPRTIGEAVTDVRQLLHEQSITIEPTTLRFTQAEQVTEVVPDLRTVIPVR